MIEHKRIKGLSFDDILLPPVRSDIRSRVDPEHRPNTQTYLGGGHYLGIPFIASPMDTVTEIGLAKEMSRLGGLGLIHRFMSPEEQARQLQELSDYNESIGSQTGVVATIGVGEKEFARLEYLLERVSGITMISIDIANGFSILMEEMIERIHKAGIDIPIMAGNIASFAGYMFMADLGISAVRVGIGGGCLAANTKILMADGSEKNIVDISPGESVINREGKAVKVKKLINSGFKKVKKVRFSNSKEAMFITEDHRLWAGDLRNIASLNKVGKAKVLGRKNIDGSSKVNWLPIGEFKKKSVLGLLPKNINFDLPLSFDINMLELIKRGVLSEDKMVTGTTSKQHYNLDLNSNYDLGYIFGTFLGDGSSNVYFNGKSNCGNVKWYFSFNEMSYAEKLMSCIKGVFGAKSSAKKKDNVIEVSCYSKPLAHMLDEFGKKDNKHLPRKFYAKNKKYIRGIYDGLIDSDGWRENNGRESFSNTSIQLRDLFCLCCMILGKSFSASFRGARIGGLASRGGNIENFNDIFTAKTHTSRRSFKDNDDEYFYSELLDFEDVNIEMETWDIEVDCPTQSFIANGVVVHNSACKTRIQTGFGIPTLSSVVDCARARHKLSFYRGTPKHELPAIIADGGIRYGADVVKSIIGGADAVICGGIFARTKEAPGEIIETENGLFKRYRGSASADFQKDKRGGLKAGTCAEGQSFLVPYSGTVEEVLMGEDGYVGGLVSGMCYANSRTINELKDFKDYVVITSSSINESHSHGTRR